MSSNHQREGTRHCSVARALDVVGEKWSLLAIREMMLGTHRFGEMVKNTGAPRDILTARLRKLEEEGLLERRPYSTRPERYEYHLTELGATLNSVISVLRQWGDDHLAGPEGPPLIFTHSCGHELDVELVCAHCRKPAITMTANRGDVDPL
ncbi:helix-turn-helix domain-containing protein [Arthrobacter sp. NPDC080031]|uniref:winged helix-turn-helix transcriptional regulator n=1 Tax=Arthrobacter sp. NPDC080031 TaxID=3155918 RepID=UPI00345041A6